MPVQMAMAHASYEYEPGIVPGREHGDLLQYLLMIYASEGGWEKLSTEQRTQGMAAYEAYTEALKKSGVLLGSNRLKPTSSATTVKMVEGKPQVLDGPYSETKEQLGGYYLIEVENLDAALSWAARCPGAAHRQRRSSAGLEPALTRMKTRKANRAAQDAAEKVARESYGRLVAYLSTRTRGILPRPRMPWPRPFPQRSRGLAGKRLSRTARSVASYRRT